MKKICFVTAARSEYGLLKWLMKAVDHSNNFELQLVVTGAHLVRSQGYTVDIIKHDGFDIFTELDVQLDYSSQEGIAVSMGRMAEGMAHILTRLHPDYLVVLGDRYELLPICNTAFVMNIPIIHLSGGDVTEGAIDDGIRNAITMLATYHFPGTKDSALNICRMRGDDSQIWVVGEPGLDAFVKEKKLTRSELSKKLHIDEGKTWVLLTYHPETKIPLENNICTLTNIIDVLLEIPNMCIVGTYSNADYGGDDLNNLLEKKAKAYRDKIVVIPSLGTQKYINLMREVLFLIGNSSSGIIEAPLLKKPVINIGNRQKGRHLCGNIIQCGTEKSEIQHAVLKAMSGRLKCMDAYYWGDGCSAERIMDIFNNELV